MKNICSSRSVLAILSMIILVSCQPDHSGSIESKKDSKTELAELSNSDETEDDFFPSEYDKNVELSTWEAGSCDDSYDPYRLINRISDIHIENDITYLTFSFSANCCSRFKPKLYFKNDTLHINPFDNMNGEYCSCDCCFSIQIGVIGLLDRNYVTEFDQQIVEFSEHPYEVFEETFELIEGKVLNRKNKYGLYEGLWITYNEDSSIIKHALFNEVETDINQSPIWVKEYSRNGQLIYHYRNDSTERWSDSGKLNFKSYTYYVGDTTFDQVVNYYDNGVLEKKKLTKGYPTTFHSDFDPEYSTTGSVTETIYDDQYYENGQMKHQFKEDTIRTWHPNGQISKLNYSNGRMQFDSLGVRESQSLTWYERGPVGFGDLRFILFVNFYPNGNVSQIHFDRDEPTEGGVAVSVDYYWKWNKFWVLTESPGNWEEPLPWERFKN